MSLLKNFLLGKWNNGLDMHPLLHLHHHPFSIIIIIIIISHLSTLSVSQLPNLPPKVVSSM
ncbi:hypothetical protein YC2023_096383 [Brassica napus]